MTKVKTLASFAAIVLAVSVYILNDIYALEGDAEAKLGPYDFLIPAEYGPKGFMNLSLRWFTGKFQSDEVAVFVVSEEELKESIPGYEVSQTDIPRNIRGLIRVWSDPQIRGVKDSGRYASLWHGTGPYQNRQVIQNDGLFRVYRDPASRKTWIVLKMNPTANEPLPSHSFDFWVARCRSQSRPMQTGDAFTICNSYVLADNIVVEFYLVEENLRYIDEIRKFVIQKVGAWYI